MQNMTDQFDKFCEFCDRTDDDSEIYECPKCNTMFCYDHRQFDADELSCPHCGEKQND